MKVEQFLRQHHIARNPFAEEDAQTDPVFKNFCIDTTHHPAWQKVMGDPAEPSTAIVFGEKGAGKTALRLQIEREVSEYNRRHPTARLYLIRYDDWNPFLDQFKDRHRAGLKIEKLLSLWNLWDHMDAILSLGVTDLVSRILSDQESASSIHSLDASQRRDLLLLVSCYDHAPAENFDQRWVRVRKRLRYRPINAMLTPAIGIVATLAALTLLVVGMTRGTTSWLFPSPGRLLWTCFFVLLAGWVPYAWRYVHCYWLGSGVCRQLKTIARTRHGLARVLTRFAATDLAGQPFPNKNRTDDRYVLLGKMQGLLRVFGYGGTLIVVDRVDEPHLVNGMATRMKALVWPILDNKFLKHPGLGLKLMLPAELVPYLESEDRDFHQRARLDKQNVISALGWTGEALQDVANARIAACALAGSSPKLRDLFDGTVSSERLLEVLRALRVPRHLFKFLYRLLVAHCNAHTDEQPLWEIPAPLLESTLAVYLREQDLAENRLRV
ncbi:MAG: hypothetical protein O3C60_05040 [Planctomycetota bacterium]|nr:hypothetical protein [Planctomycetota bacterium]